MLNTYKNKNKFGFSLFEVVVTMSIVVIFIAACSSVFTMKKRDRVATPAHGRMECYYVKKDDGSVVLHQRLYYEKMLTADNDLPATETQCHYTPPSTAAFLIVSAIGGGGAGNATRGGSAGQFKNEFIPVTTHHLFLQPGRGAEYIATGTQTDGSPSLVFDGGKDGNDPVPQQILNVAGGISASNYGTLRWGDCALLYTRYSCNVDQYCSVNNTTNTVTVNYCAGTNTSDFTHKNVSINSILANYNMSDITTESLIKYEDVVQNTGNDGSCNPVDDVRNFAFALNVIGNVTEDAENSHMDKYVNALGITDGIKNVNPGNGGAKYTTAGSADGGSGAVVVVW